MDCDQRGGIRARNFDWIEGRALALENAHSSLDAAMVLAGRGGFDFGMWIAEAAGVAIPDDASILYRAGLLARVCGEVSAALVLFGRAVVVEPLHYSSMIEIGDLCRAREERERALRWYRQAIECAPHFPDSYLKAAEVEMEVGRNASSLQLLEALEKRMPHHVECNKKRTQVLYLDGRYEDALKALVRLLEDGCTDEPVRVGYVTLLTLTGRYREILSHVESYYPSRECVTGLRLNDYIGHAKLAISVDAERVAEKAARREASPSWLGVDAVFSELREAITAGRAFSMVRLGDGEGRFLSYFDRRFRDVLSPAENEAMLRVIWSNWFGEANPLPGSQELEALHEQLRAAIAGADVIGITAHERHISDHYHRGYLAAMEGVVEDIFGDVEPPRFASALVMVELQEVSPFLKTLLCGVETIDVISPHPGLAARLARYCGIEGFREHVVPGETRLPEAARGQTGRSHYPERFSELMEQIVVPRPGAVFLVAAGLLGKIYCHRIRQLGGIALDVGSVVDAWMGFFETRPPGLFQAPEKWRLPGDGDGSSQQDGE